jgi:hypothetical protein
MYQVTIIRVRVTVQLIIAHPLVGYVGVGLPGCVLVSTSYVGSSYVQSLDIEGVHQTRKFRFSCMVHFGRLFVND